MTSQPDLTVIDPLEDWCRAHPCNNLTFRRAGPADVDAIHGLIRSAYSHYVPMLGYEPAPMRRDYTLQLTLNPVWLAEEDGVLAGLLELIMEPDAVMVEDVAVSPRFQGRKLGRWFMDFAEEVARVNGYRTMRLYTNQKMERNQAVYAHLGYAETHRAVTEGIPRVYMEKHLA